MDISRKQFTNIEPGKKTGSGPANIFIHTPEYPRAELKTIVRPNLDTLYSLAWLDLSEQPKVISIPDTGGRYYLAPMLDMWTDVFASPGWRTTGTGPQTCVLVALGWSPDLRDRIISDLKFPKETQIIDAPTPWV